MIKLILKEHNEDRVIYYYSYNDSEDKDDYGIIEYNFKSKEYKDVKMLKGDKGRLAAKAELCLEKAVEANDFKDSLSVVWA